jgi:hypothetical protein
MPILKVLMWRFKLVELLFISAVSVCISSCKTEFISPTFKPATAAAISKLPENQKIKGKEIMDWYTANLQSTRLEPHWDKPMQTVFNNHQVIMVPVGQDAALFFSKIKGMLNVDAYKWQDKDPGSKYFTGNIVDYSFQTNKISGLVYYRSTLIRKGTMQLPPISVVQLIDTLMLTDLRSWIQSHQKTKERALY